MLSVRLSICDHNQKSSSFSSIAFSVAIVMKQLALSVCLSVHTSSKPKINHNKHQRVINSQLHILSSFSSINFLIFSSLLAQPITTFKTLRLIFLPSQSTIGGYPQPFTLGNSFAGTLSTMVLLLSYTSYLT